MKRFAGCAQSVVVAERRFLKGDVMIARWLRLWIIINVNRIPRYKTLRVLGQK